MVAISEALGILDESTDLPRANHVLIHALGKL